jgi:hypothetical protein
METRENPVWYGVLPTLLVVGFGIACGAGGATFGENSPGNSQYGGGTYVDDAVVDDSTPEGVGENGSIAVDPDTEIAYTLQKRLAPDQTCENDECPRQFEKRLVAIPPDGEPFVMMSLDDYVDVRVLFPSDSVLVMAQPEWSEEAVASGDCKQPDDADVEQNLCGDELHWFDKSSHRKLTEKRTDARYHGTRLSPKRNWLAVADNFRSPAPLHLVNTHTGDVNVVPQDGAWFEAMWMHREDRMISAHFSALWEDDDGETDAFLTIRDWFPSRDGDRAIAGESVCFFGGGPAPSSCDSIAIGGITPLYGIGFSWIGLSDDDRWVAVPARTEDGAVTVLVDRTDHSVELLHGVYGPVGFTPDNETMVAYGWENEEEMLDSRLLFIDLETGDVEEQPVPQMTLPTYFVSHDSNEVVVVNTGGSQELVLFDLEAGTRTTLPGPAVAARGLPHYEELAGFDPTAPQYRYSPVSRRVLEPGTEKPRLAEDSRCLDRVCDLRSPTTVSLGEFVQRRGHRELWLVERGELLRLDLEAGQISEMTLDGTPAHINILPSHDRLILDTRNEQMIRYYDPELWRVDRTTSIELGWQPVR